MFEQEIEMEKKEGAGFGPILIILLLVALFVGGAGIVIFQSKQTISPQQAKTAVENTLKSAEPESVTFHTGTVSYSGSEKPSDAQYVLLERAGLIKRGKASGHIWGAQVDLTPAGKSFLAQFPEVNSVKEKDGTVGYTLPLASRKLISVDKVTKLAQHRFEVQYTWTWQTTKAGDMFDISGALVQSLPTYDRSMLIDQHGANYYHVPPMQAKVMLIKEDDALKPIY